LRLSRPVLTDSCQELREIAEPQIISLRRADAAQVSQPEKVLAAGHLKGFAEQSG